MRGLARGSLLSCVLTLSGVPALAEPLDPTDPTPRSVRVEFETSSDPAVVGTTWSPPSTGSWSVSGAVGTLVIPGEAYESLVGSSGALESSDIVIEITLATGAAVATANGTVTLAGGGYTWSWGLDTGATVGFVEGGPLLLACASQADVDALCSTVPAFCGATCVQVPGSAYDAPTGRLNLVGYEHQEGCGEAGCATVDVFTPRGDLRLSEAPPPPAVPAGAALPLVLGLLGSAVGWLGLRRAPRRSPAGRPRGG